MLFAIDSSGNKTNIDSVQCGQEYFCPCCNSKLILKMGEIKAHHFAHSSGSVCHDAWHYDMSMWHYDWQNQFPIECQEVVKSFNGQKHRADVLLENAKIVVEFQHSNLSAEEFEDRNSFYNKLGYKVIWIFDVSDAYENDHIENYKGDLWRWTRPKKTFDYLDYKKSNILIYLQLREDLLVKVTWCAEYKGLSRFATDGNRYSQNAIVNNMFDENCMKREFKLSELYDSLIPLYSKDHTTYYSGCPISGTHVCANCNIDVPKSQYDEIMPCMDCDFKCENDDYDNPICTKRFVDLNLDPNTFIRIESRDNNGFINKISFMDGDNRIYRDLVTFEQNLSKSVLDLWDDGYSIATFKNIRTGKYIRINKNPKKQYSKYHKVYGYLSSSQYEFPNTSVELFGIEKREWFCVWYRYRK